MQTDSDLHDSLSRIDGKGYKAYKDLTGEYRFPGYRLIIDHVQGDPFAAPSRIRVRLDRKKAGFPEDLTANRSRTVALCDFLTRVFSRNCRRIARGNRGIGKSGLIAIDQPTQEILERSAMRVDGTFVEARFFMGLPALGRRISAPDARAMFFDELPQIVNSALRMDRLDRKRVYRHVDCSEDADILRSRLEALGLIGFVADGALLPRASGIDPSPLKDHRAVKFQSPDRFRIEVDLPHAGTVSGMGIPKGVTLIVGGGYHGKSTLLNALQLGIYNHIPEDGRELAVTVAETVTIRAADGRSIEKTDISPFINNLPFAQDTRSFSTRNASGSTSQAAGICEALEAGARLLLLDEDTSATNFMIRDHRMQQLVAKENEPITPFIDKIRQLYDERGVSTVLVMGGSGDYFATADHVIQMTDYLPADVTRRAREIARADEDKRLPEGGERFGDIRTRIPLKAAFNPYRGNNRIKIAASRLREIRFGNLDIDLWDLDQIVDISQTRAIGYALHHATRHMDGRRSLKAVIDLTLADIDRDGLEILPPYLTGDLARFRGFELAFAINRMRNLKMRQRKSPSSETQ